MNSQKEVEYIAEIVRLKRELAKSPVVVLNDVSIAPADLLRAANHLLSQVCANSDGIVRVVMNEITECQLISGLESYRYQLSATLITPIG